MNRRQFLRLTALGGSSSAVARVAAHDSGPAGADVPDTGTTATSTPTATPSPTEAVATPTSGWEPRGDVAVPGATETVGDGSVDRPDTVADGSRIAGTGELSRPRKRLSLPDERVRNGVSRYSSP